jgi:hypothetical protein
MIRNAGKIKKQTYLIAGIFFAVLLVGALFSYADPILAAADGATKAAGTTESGSDWGVGAAIETVVKSVLYGFFVLCGWLAGIAIAIFTSFVNPDIFQILNSQGVYSMWQFIRDFFNLFFILTLLYIAFTTIFQVAKDYKKALLNLVIMALLVNFSFPISRFLIDAGNVPMYYFANQISPDGRIETGLGAIFNASRIQGILVFGSVSAASDAQGNPRSVGIGDVVKLEFAHLIAAIVFLFVFAITLLVLAVMFVIRFAVLVVLVIFSSVGFAGTVIPGMNKFANQWWESFTQYVIYGPAAMLMVLVSIRFFDALDTSGTGDLITDVATNVSDKEMVGFISSAAMFSIPIVILWIAIGLSSKMSIAGSAAVTGAGFTAIGWAKKKTIGGAKWMTYRNPVARGVGAGMKERLNEGKMFGVNYGKNPVGKLLTGNFWKAPSATEAVVRGVAGTSSVKTELEKLHQQKVNTQIKENKDKQINRSALLTSLNSGDKVERQAAALSLAENGEIRTTQDLTQALTALRTSVDKDGNNEYDQNGADWMLKVLDKAKDGATVGMTAEDYGKIVKANDNVFYRKKADGKTFEEDPKTHERIPTGALEAFNSKLKKDGQIKVRVDYEIGKGAGVDSEKVYDNLIGKLNAEDFAKQGSVHSAIGKDDGLKEYLKKRVGKDENFYQEALKKMKGTDREKLRDVMPEGKGQGSADVREKMKQAKSSNQR